MRAIKQTHSWCPCGCITVKVADFCAAPEVAVGRQAVERCGWASKISGAYRWPEGRPMAPDDLLPVPDRPGDPHPARDRRADSEGGEGDQGSGCGQTEPVRPADRRHPHDQPHLEGQDPRPRGFKRLRQACCGMGALLQRPLPNRQRTAPWPEWPSRIIHGADRERPHGPGNPKTRCPVTGPQSGLPRISENRYLSEGLSP
jgi:hypothetical protein